MWGKLGRLLAKGAVWCLGNADTLITVAGALKGKENKDNKNNKEKQ